MSILKIALASSLAVTLMACGGGGSDTLPGSPNVPVVLDKTEFLGTWHRMDIGTCFTNFAYSANYWFTADPLVITDTTIVSTLTTYTDAACTLKAGKITETHDANFSQGSVAGKTNVLRMNMVFTGFTAGADGGSGMTLSKVPDGSATGGNVKGLLDVDVGKLYPNSKTAPLDADAYPTALSSTVYYTR